MNLFSAQTVELDLKAYKRFCIIFKIDGGAYTEAWCSEKDKLYSHTGNYVASGSYQMGEGNCYIRSFTVTDSGVSFGSGRTPQLTAARDGAMIPIKIIGYTY